MELALRLPRERKGCTRSHSITFCRNGPRACRHTHCTEHEDVSFTMHIFAVFQMNSIGFVSFRFVSSMHEHECLGCSIPKFEDVSHGSSI